VTLEVLGDLTAVIAIEILVYIISSIIINFYSLKNIQIETKNENFSEDGGKKFTHHVLFDSISHWFLLSFNSASFKRDN
jgi:hypothetical protein